MFEIKEKYYKDESTERFDFYAEKDGKLIFNTDIKVYRFKSCIDFKWQPWQTSWPSSGSGSLEEKAPHFATIKKAMEKLEELSN